MFSGGVSSSVACWASEGFASVAGVGALPGTFGVFVSYMGFLGDFGAGDLGFGVPQKSSAMLLRLLLTSVLIRSIWVCMISSRLSMIVLLSVDYKGITDAD
jgi:hypothetical protein